MAHDITKEFRNNSHFENMSAAKISILVWQFYLRPDPPTNSKTKGQNVHEFVLLFFFVGINLIGSRIRENSGFILS